MAALASTRRPAPQGTGVAVGKGTFHMPKRGTKRARSPQPPSAAGRAMRPRLRDDVGALDILGAAAANETRRAAQLARAASLTSGNSASQAATLPPAPLARGGTMPPPPSQGSRGHMARATAPQRPTPMQEEGEFPSLEKLESVAHGVRSVSAQGAVPDGFFTPTDQAQLKRLNNATASALDDAVHLQGAVPDGERSAEAKLAMRLAELLAAQTRARAVQQQQMAVLSDTMATQMSWSLRYLKKYHGALAAAQTAAEVSTHSAMSSRSTSLRLPRTPPGVHEHKEGENIHFWTASIKSGGFWYRQEKTKFLATLQRELQGLQRGLNPVSHPSFGWAFGQEGWMWAELDSLGCPNGCFLWAGPDPDMLPDTTTEKSVSFYWQPGHTVIRFYPVWLMRPPQRVQVGQLDHKRMVPADDTATTAQATVVQSTAVAYWEEDGEVAEVDTGVVLEAVSSPPDLPPDADMSSGAATLLAAAAQAAGPDSDGASTVPFEGEGDR